MLKEFKLPELGENIESADVTKVLVAVGDTIKNDQIVLEIETDKATVEVPSELSGVVKEINIKEGETAKVGSVLFIIEEESDSKQKISNAEIPSENKNEQPAQKEVSIRSESTSSSELIDFILPELGENIESANITKVLVSVGDFIEKDQVILEIETDKATVEVPNENAGIVKEIFIKEGDEVKVGQTIFTISTRETPQKTEESVTSEVVVEKKVEMQHSEKSINKDVTKTETKLLPRREEIAKRAAPAAPSVRRFAREIGIDIHQVKGTGPGGRISIEDIKTFAKIINENLSKSSLGAPIGIAVESLPDFSKWGEIDTQPMNNIRKKTAEHLSFAWATIPHVTQFDKADITDLEKLRKQFAPKVEAAGGKLTITAILLKIIASALVKFPQFNASVDMGNKSIIYKKYFNIGIAVDTEKGLLVPVLRDVDKKNITQLSVELSEISIKSRNNKLTLDDLQGGNFSISNLGGIGGTYFTPVVNSPEVAILGVSRGNYEPVHLNGEFVARLMLPLSLSYDHRVIDGADAARFIRWISDALENPFLLSLDG